MTDNYDQELEHSVNGTGTRHRGGCIPALEDENISPNIGYLPLRQVLQRQRPLWKATPLALCLQQWLHSSQSSSPIGDLSELQSDVHLAVNSMFTTKRSSDLEIQGTIRDFEASLHQREAEAAATNKKAKVTHSRRDLRAKVKCAKAVMKAKYDYRMTVQKARAERCTELRGIRSHLFRSPQQKRGQPVSPVHQALLRTYRKYEGIGNMCFKGREQKPPGLLVSTSSSPTPSPTITEGRSPFFVTPFYWDHHRHLVNPSLSHQCPRWEGGHSPLFPLKPEPKWSPPPKRQHSSMEGQGDTSMDEDFPHTLTGGIVGPQGRQDS